MTKCKVCGQDTDLPYTCNYCGRNHCAEHRLPENHFCQPGGSSDDGVFASVAPSTLSKKASELTNRSGDRESTSVDHQDGVGSSRSYGEGGDDSPPVRTKSDNSKDSGFGDIGLVAGLKAIIMWAYSVILLALLSPLYVLRFLLKPAILGSVLLIFLLVAATVGTGVPAIDTPVNDAKESVGAWVDNATSGPTGTSADGSSTQTPSASAASGNGEYSVEVVESEFINLLNSNRSDQALRGVSTRSSLQEMAMDHSQVMADAGRIEHEGLGDGTIEQRFERRGLLPECRIDIGNNQFYPGAENVAETSVEVTVVSHWADGGSYRITSEEDLAYVLYNQWMTSPGHRRPMMAEDLQTVGLGFVIDDEDRVYAALEMCGS